MCPQMSVDQVDQVPGIEEATATVYNRRQVH